MVAFAPQTLELEPENLTRPVSLRLTFLLVLRRSAWITYHGPFTSARPFSALCGNGPHSRDVGFGCFTAALRTCSLTGPPREGREPPSPFGLRWPGSKSGRPGRAAGRNFRKSPQEQ